MKLQPPLTEIVRWPQRFWSAHVRNIGQRQGNAQTNKNGQANEIGAQKTLQSISAIHRHGLRFDRVLDGDFPEAHSAEEISSGLD